MFRTILHLFNAMISKVSAHLLLLVNLVYLSLFILNINSTSQQPDVTFSFPSKNLNATYADKKYIALTFDDGPHLVLTPRLLGALRQFPNAKVTFFVMGLKVVMHPHIVRQELAEGHEVANHAWNHPVLSKIPWQSVELQLQSTNEAIFNATNTYPKVMRPPYGNTNRGLNRRIATETNLPVIMWSIDTQDWQRPGVESILKKVRQKITAGSVILCHDIHPDTITAIPLIIKELEAKGYEFKTISEMFQIYFPN